ncbi:MAG TPA: glycosyltransferase family 39 protein [Chloroflexota bacterium]
MITLRPFASGSPRAWRLSQAVLARATAGQALAALALLVIVPASAIAASRGFDGLYGQDAYAYFDYASGPVRQSILHLAPLEAFFWPPGYPVLVALASLVIGPVPLAGQIVSLVMGGLVAVLTARLAREVWPGDPARALVAGLSVGVSGQLWQSSLVVMADTTGLALATFSALALVRYASNGRFGWLAAASAAIAWATLARWIYGLVAIPFAAYALWALSRERPRRLALAHGLAASVLALAILGPLLGPSVLGLMHDPTQPATFAGNLQVYSWSPLNAARRDFFTADGHLQYALPNGVYYAIAPANLALFGPLLAAWIVVGAYAARGWRWPTLTLIVGWAAIVYAFHAGAPWQNFRFTLAYLPPLAILLATGLLSAWRSVGRRLRGAVGLCAALGLLLAAGDAVRVVERFIDTKDQDLALVRWTQVSTPPAAQLLTFGPTLTFRHYSGLVVFDLFDLSQSELSSMLAAPTARYALVDESSLDSQWLGQAPANNFSLVRERAGLTLLGSHGSYRLYRVGPT